MARPTYAQFRDNTSSANSLPPESVQERILTCLAVFLTRQNPDGTTF